jgi:pyruvate/2-oxoglutarate dehydrogenase complex dihydrolipoamide acyltransferase (E2) component
MSSITIITLPNGITIETTNGGALAEALATIAAVPAVPAQAPKAPKAKAEAPAQAPEAEAPAPKAPKAPKATKAKGRTKEENKALYAEITGLTRAGRFTEARSMAEAFLRTSHSLLGAVFLSWVVAAWARAGQLKGSITQGAFLANSPFAKTPFAMLRSQP